MKDYELLEAQARMMRMAENYGVSHWTKLVKYLGETLFDFRALRHLDEPLDDSENRYTFALGVVEGKPVFVGDTLYNKTDGYAKTIVVADEDIWILVCRCDLSWNPPAPNTVMVELMVEDAKQIRDSWAAYPRSDLAMRTVSAINAGLEAQSAK